MSADTTEIIACVLERSLPRETHLSFLSNWGGNPVINGVVVKRRSRYRGPVAPADGTGVSPKKTLRSLRPLRPQPAIASRLGEAGGSAVRKKKRISHIEAQSTQRLKCFYVTRASLHLHNNHEARS